MKTINISGLEDYSITKDGKIYSQKSNKFLKIGTSTKGYSHVFLMNGGKSKAYYVHRLLMLTYFPPKDDSLVVNHIDGDKKNNRLDNLEWVTNRQNLLHALDSGLRKMDSFDHKGENNPNSKLKKEDVVFIYESLKNKDFSQKQLSERFEVSQMSISNIKNKKKWKKLTDEIDEKI